MNSPEILHQFLDFARSDLLSFNETLSLVANFSNFRKTCLSSLYGYTFGELGIAS